jgi:hypothetical protein
MMDNYGNIDLWKRNFRKLDSKRFGIVTLYDATKESAVSNLKVIFKV